MIVSMTVFFTWATGRWYVRADYETVRPAARLRSVGKAVNNLPLAAGVDLTGRIYICAKCETMLRGKYLTSSS